MEDIRQGHAKGESLHTITEKNARKDGKWQHYSLNREMLTQFKEFIEGLTCCGSNGEGGCCS